MNLIHLPSFACLPPAIRQRLRRPRVFSKGQAARDGLREHRKREKIRELTGEEEAEGERTNAHLWPLGVGFPYVCLELRRGAGGKPSRRVTRMTTE
jgi:hypothetical protein